MTWVTSEVSSEFYNRDYKRKCAQKQNILKNALSDCPSANVRPLFNSNMTKVSVLNWSQNCNSTIRSGVVGIPKYFKYACKAGYFTIFAMQKTPLLSVLVQFWDHFKTDTFFTLLFESGLIFALGQSESVFGRISLCNPNCKFNLKFRPWRSWANMLKMVVVDQSTQRHNKNSQPACLDFLTRIDMP